MRPTNVALLREQQRVARHLHVGMGRHRAVLDHDRAGIARLIDRRIGDEQRMIAQRPGQRFVRAHAGGAFRARDDAHLRGAGLARHRDSPCRECASR